MASRIYGRWLLHGYTNSGVGMESVAVRTIMHRSSKQHLDHRYERRVVACLIYS